MVKSTYVHSQAMQTLIIFKTDVQKTLDPNLLQDTHAPCEDYG